MQATTAVTSKKPPTAPPHEPPPAEGAVPTDAHISYREVGREAAREAQRRYLLDHLERNDWNLSKTARETGLDNASNLTKEIHKVGLTAEYEAAKAAGKISKGSR
jgi:transcriptional regulator with GAF, ATPase, and Fis domain